ncbi:MAG: sigma-70 family RNA polymerase sigma factor [Acidobacteria bacterium]|nr:sigma-70 family RNA polymerase sigma factor [Acidobacteriota bacterium]
MVLRFKEGRGRAESFRWLFDRYYNQLYSFFRRKGMLPEDSHDLTQEAFISIFKGLQNFREEESFEIWMFAIAKNVYRRCLEYRGAAKRWGQHISLDEAKRPGNPEGAAYEIRGPEAGALDVLLDHERRERVRAALLELPPQMRRCMQLHVVEDLSSQEIAAIMGLSINTVKVHLHQARAALKQKLDPEFFNDPGA